MQMAEPTIAVPQPRVDQMVPKIIGARALPGRKDARYVPERGLVRRLRTAQANDDISALAARHELDPETRERLAAELIKAGAPPITPKTAEAALSRLVRFDPLNADALRPFLILSLDRGLRAHAMVQIGLAMRKAGRSVRLLSDAVDLRENTVLIEAGKQLGCAMTRYDGSPNCADILRKTDLACLSVIEAGFRAPLDKIAMLRLNTLTQATGAEPVVVMRPRDADLALALSKIGVKRVVVVRDADNMTLGPILSALRKADLSIAEILDVRDGAPSLCPARAAGLAALLTDTAHQ